MMEYGESYTTSVPVSVPGMPMRDGSVSNVSGSSQGMMAPDMYYPDEYPYPYYNQDVPVTDTREFLKVNYNASMQTRDVQGLTRRVETTVRGYNGRIDQESSSPQYGYVSFVVPSAKYDAFRDELEALVGSRFLTVNISSQNLLPQKQSIEEQQKQADSALADYKAARQKVVNAHAGTVQSLQSQIDTDAQILLFLRAETPTPQIQAQIQAVSDEWTSGPDTVRQRCDRDGLGLYSMDKLLDYGAALPAGLLDTSYLLHPRDSLVPLRSPSIRNRIAARLSQKYSRLNS